MTTAIETAQGLHTAIELGRVGQELEDLFTEDVTFTEYPNLVKPSGGPSVFGTCWHHRGPVPGC